MRLPTGVPRVIARRAPLPFILSLLFLATLAAARPAEVRAQQGTADIEAPPQRTAWLPTTSMLEAEHRHVLESITTLSMALLPISTPPPPEGVSTSATSWSAERCVSREHADTALFECEEVSIFASHDRTLHAKRLQWRASSGELIRAEEVRQEHGGEPRFEARTLQFVPGDDGSSPQGVEYVGVTMWLPAASGELRAQKLLIEPGALRLDELVWLEGDEAFATARSASVTRRDPSRQPRTTRLAQGGDAWKTQGLEYVHVYRRESLEVGSWTQHRGLLPIRVGYTSEGVRRFIGEEAMVSPLGKHGQLFAGVWGGFEEVHDPNEVEPGSAGVSGLSAGFASTSAVAGAWSGVPLRLDVGLSQEGPSRVRASLHGDAVLELQGEHQHIDMHLEEGTRALVAQNIRASDKGLRAWQQSRIGASLGFPGTIFQTGVVHESREGAWQGQMMLGGSQSLDFLSGLRAEYLVDHTSRIEDRRTHEHESLLYPGVTLHRGSMARAYFKAHSGLSFGQTAYQDRVLKGIDTAQSISAQGSVEGGLSLEGRLTRRLRHRLSPRLVGFISPVSWSRPRRTGGATSEDEKRGALASLVTLDQSIVLLGEKGAYEALSLELPMSHLFSTQWLVGTQGTLQQAMHLTLSPAVRVRPRGLTDVELGVTSWLCQTSDTTCRKLDLRQLGVELSKPGRWSVGYFQGTMNERLMALKWLSAPGMHAGALQATRWLDTLRGARLPSPITQGMHTMTARLAREAWALDMFVFMLPDYSREDTAAGWSIRASYTPPSTGWSWEMLVSIDDTYGSDWMGAMLTWSGR